MYEQGLSDLLHEEEGTEGRGGFERYIGQIRSGVGVVGLPFILCTGFGCSSRCHLHGLTTLEITLTCLLFMFLEQ